MDDPTPFLKELTSKEIFSAMAAILGSIAGAWWGARLRLRQSHAALDREARKRQQSQLSQKISFLKALLAEVRVLWRRYHDLLGRDVERFTARDIRSINHMFSQDYFTVYHCSAAMLGSIENSAIPPLVVDTYLQAKAVIDIVQVISQENREVVGLEDDRNRVGASAAQAGYYERRIAMIRERADARYEKLVLEHDKFRRIVTEFTDAVGDEIARLARELEEGVESHVAAEAARGRIFRKASAMESTRADSDWAFHSDMKIGPRNTMSSSVSAPRRGSR
jgi:hypothetical protein